MTQKSVVLRAGPLRALLEGDDLRQICGPDGVILDRIYAPVRDRDWLTVPRRRLRQHLRLTEDSFFVSLLVEYRAPGIRLLARISYRGTADGTISARFFGWAGREFWRNRIGFCLHHPMALAGSTAVLRHHDARTTPFNFPELPAPHQPAVDLHGMLYTVGAWQAELEFTGDVFEMEDQRQWGDASFKTYCTPLALPRPARIAKGTQISQRITLRLRSAPGKKNPLPAVPGPAHQPATRPMIGRARWGTAWAGRRPDASEMAFLRRLALTYLRVDLDLAAPAWREEVSEAAQVANELSWGLELAIRAESVEPEQLAHLASHVSTMPIEAVLVVDTAERSNPAAALAQVKSIPWNSPVKFGLGTCCGFTEVNRGRPSISSGDLLTFRINGQEHADDDRSLLENCAVGPILIRAAQALAPGAGVVIGPLLLCSRTGIPDRRWRSPFACRWLAGMLSGLAEAERICIAELTGPRGLIEGIPAPATGLLIRSATTH